MCEQAAKIYELRNATFYWGTFDFDDLLSWAYLGAISAVDLYDPTIGKAKLKSYAWHRINGEIVDGIRTIYGRRGVKKAGLGLPVDPQSHLDKTGSMVPSILETISYDEPGYGELDEQAVMDSLPKLLEQAGVKPRNIRVFLRYLDGETLMAIAISEGFTESRACQLVRDCRRALRESGLHDVLVA